MNPLDTSITNIWRSWFYFYKGKRKSSELEAYRYNLEANLKKLRKEIINGTYKHGRYRQFVVCDNKKRQIKVATIEDRIVHRLVYNYLVKIYDRTFIYDVWSCRKSKGLHKAINRSQQFMRSNNGSFVWRSDIKKFFDNVDKRVLLSMLKRTINDKSALYLLTEIIGEPSRQDSSLRLFQKGIPIGNLTSQILANIYLNEFDRYIKHQLKVKYYLRYGDDFIIFANNKDILHKVRNNAKDFLETTLGLSVNINNDIIVKSKLGIRFLGVHIFPHGRRLGRRTMGRTISKLTLQNHASYWGLVHKHCNHKHKLLFDWNMLKMQISGVNNPFSTLDK